MCVLFFLRSGGYEEVMNAKSGMVKYNLKSFCLTERTVLVHVANQTYFQLEVVLVRKLDCFISASSIFAMLVSF